MPRPAIASFLTPLIAVDLRPSLLEVLGRVLRGTLSPAAARTREGSLPRPFLLARQQQGNWCWASVGAGLAGYFARPAISQCQLVQTVLAPAGLDCCRSGADSRCNITARMSRVLQTLRLLARTKPTQPQGPIAFDALQADISAGKPVVCNMLGGGSAHFVVVVGWFETAGTEWVTVDDPANGTRGDVPYLRFRSGYKGRAWAQTTRLA